MQAENVLTIDAIHLDISNKKETTALVGEIRKRINALQNSNGGTLEVYHKNNLTPKELENFVRLIEQKILDSVGLLTMTSKIECKLVSEPTPKIVFSVKPEDCLSILNSGLYLPTKYQVKAIPPSESPDNVRRRFEKPQCTARKATSLRAYHQDFVLNQHTAVDEDVNVQCKSLKSQESKRVNLADRITNKSNKLICYVSGFANHIGGHIYYGINDDRVVIGQEVVDDEVESITRKVEKAIGKMIWPKHCGAPKRGKQWDIFFEPVKDAAGKLVPRTYVIVIAVAPCAGGVFAEEPESYRVSPDGTVCRYLDVGLPYYCLHGLVDQTESSYTVHKTSDGNNDKQQADADTQEETEHVKSITESDADIVPSYVGRSRWSSVHAQKVYHTVSEKFVKARNDGNLTEFEHCAKWAERKFSREHNDVNLIISAERVAFAYRSGQYKKAKELLKKFEELLDFSSSQDVEVFKFKAVYAKSAIARAEGKYEESYSIAKDGLQLAQQIPAGIVTAWFLNHVALVEVLLYFSVQSAIMERSVRFLQVLALQHAQASSIEQEFCITTAELRQQVHINRAIALLGFSGDHRFAKYDIEAAKVNLAVVHEITLEGHSQTHFREIHHNFALSDLSAYQWQQQEHKQRETQNKTIFRDREMPEALLAAFYYAKKALTCASDCRFEEMNHYANKRVSALTETMLRHNMSRIHFQVLW